MLTYHLDLEQRSSWLRATPAHTMQALGFYCTEAGVFYCKSSFATARSEKNSYLLFYTFDGEGILEQDNIVHIIRPNTLVFLDCRRPHSYCTSSAKKWDFYWAHIDGTAVKGYYDLLKPHGEPRCTNITSPHLALELWQNILKSARQDTPEETLALCLALHQILNIATSAAFQAFDGNSGSGKDICHSVAAYLRSNYAKPLNLDLLAEHMSFSKSYIIRLFKQNFGTTPYSYLLHYRITKAKELLSGTNLSVENISDQVGFGNHNNFIAQFTRLCHQSPLQYRKSFFILEKNSST